MNLKSKLFRLLKRLNLLPDNLIDVTDLELGRGLDKQRDELRELLENIEAATGYFSSEAGSFSTHHAATLDDYLCHLHLVRSGLTKPKNYVRNRPSFLPNSLVEASFTCDFIYDESVQSQTSKPNC